MSQRITEKQLQALVDRINTAAKAPKDTWTKTKDGKFKANVGNYRLDYAYGGVTLERIDNESGGVASVLGCGHVTKREAI